jgi:hypothetical protein
LVWLQHFVLFVGNRTYSLDAVTGWPASQVRHGIADVFDMDDEDLARKLADYYLANQDDLIAKNAEALTVWLRPLTPATIEETGCPDE